MNMTVLEYDTRRQLVEIDADYGVRVGKAHGRWLVTCGLCKLCRSFPTHGEAVGYADATHLRELTHEKWTGRVTNGGHLSVCRGWDFHVVGRCCECTVCPRCINGGNDARERRRQYREDMAIAARARSLAWADQRRDELAARRVVPPPRLNFSTGPAIGPATVRWPDGRASSGTFYDLFADSRFVARIVALAGGGWILRGQYVADDAALIRAAG